MDCMEGGDKASRIEVRDEFGIILIDSFVCNLAFSYSVNQVIRVQSWIFLPQNLCPLTWSSVGLCTLISVPEFHSFLLNLFLSWPLLYIIIITDK